MKKAKILFFRIVHSLFIILLLSAVRSELIGQGCTISTSNLTELSGDDGSGNCTYSIDILFIEGSGPDNGTLTFSSTSASIITGAGPHSCACSGTTYTLTFEASCGSMVSFSAFHDNSGNGNDCSISATGISLPVNWLDFSVEYDRNNNVQLSWTTALEINNEVFEVEYSFDGITFEYLAAIPGAGNSFKEKTYSHTHFFEFNRSMYFRIKQIDFDGKYSYSDIRHITPKLKKQIKIYPNPVSDILFLSQEEESLSANIYDKNGRFVMSSINNQIDVSGLARGIYYISIGNNNLGLKKILITN